MKKASVFAFILLSALSTFGQISQTVRGRVIDSDTRTPIGRARIFLLSDSTARGIVSNSKGEFVMERVPTGRHTVRIQHKGHSTRLFTNVLVQSGKETVLNVKLRVASYSENEVTETVTKNGEVSNPMAMASAREYTVDETIRYAGSRGDPLRVALNFAGVQGLDDSRNDLVIRGNNPYGMAIQIDGVALMNTNHFATPGTNGGPLSKISFKALDNSDFYSGVMPAEFGNATSGVMDLKLKTGNNKKHEQGIYLGVLGADIFVEGPISKKKGSSYLINYRYSTVALFLDMGLDLGTSSEPFYQDLNFKFNFPYENGSELSFWGVTGNSISNITLSDDTEPSLELYGDNDRDQYLESGLDVLGFTYNKPINDKTFLKSTLAYSLGYVYTNDDYIVSRDVQPDGSFNPEGVVTTPVLDYAYDISKITFANTLNRRIGDNKLLKAGFIVDYYNSQFLDSTRVISTPDWVNNEEWVTRWNNRDQEFMYQYFAQLKQEFGQKLSATLGLHGTYYTLGNSSSFIEPRLGMRYNYAVGKTLALGLGLYSQMQPQYLHYYKNIDGELINNDMGLTKNWQGVLSHSWDVNSKIKFTAEAYYQYLFDIPVEQIPSAFSLINTGTGFSRVFPNELENSGNAYNYGLELSAQRFFDNGYSYLINGTLYQSKYKGSDGIVRNTNFNGNYMFNALGTKEFNITENTVAGIGANITYAGGRRYGEFDEEQSELEKEVVWQQDGYNENQYKDYFRTDIRANIVFNRSKITHEIAIDLINVLGTNNVLDYAWAPGINTNSNFALREQIGFFPMFYYKLDF